jgi:hypothetical protein
MLPWHVHSVAQVQVSAYCRWLPAGGGVTCYPPWGCCLLLPLCGRQDALVGGPTRSPLHRMLGGNGSRPPRQLPVAWWVGACGSVGGVRVCVAGMHLEQGAAMPTAD